jgi:hypothetical protein
MTRIQQLVERGPLRAFCTDLPTSWLMGTMHSVVHNTADEIYADRVDPDQAAAYIAVTVFAAFTPSGHSSPTLRNIQASPNCRKSQFMVIPLF